jgi:predicted ABC-type ATPase
MAKRAKAQPRCIIIAGPNGAGKTTFARNYLLKDAGIENFVNADSIAAGLSPLKPEPAARAAGRLLLQQIDRLATAGESFALESTLSGSTYRDRLNRLKDMGYRIEHISAFEQPRAGHQTGRLASKAGWPSRAGG